MFVDMAMSSSRASMNSDISDTPQGRISRWAISLDAVLQDSLGLAAFTSFLRKEYSEENLQFWIECESSMYMKKNVKGIQIFRFKIGNVRGERDRDGG